MIYSFHPFNKHTNIRVDFNIWYGNMNQISNYRKEKVIESHKKEEKTGFLNHKLMILSRHLRRTKYKKIRI